MKKFAVAIGMAACLSGCSTAHKVDAIRHDVDAGRVKGMAKETRFAFAFPNFHEGPYAEVDDFNVKIEEGTYKGQNATFFLGKSHDSGKWEVISVMIQKNGKWEAIPLTLVK